MKDYNKYSDIELTTLLREGGEPAENAFNAIYTKYSARIYGFCLYRTEAVNNAQELMQDVWMKFLSSVRAGRTTDNILAFLLKIARNQSIDNYRKTRSNREQVIDRNADIDFESIADPFQLDEYVEKKEFDKLVKMAVNTLDDKYKEAVTLYWFGDCSYKEIGEILGITSDAARVRISRGFKQLSEILKPYFFDDIKKGKEKNG